MENILNNYLQSMKVLRDMKLNCYLKVVRSKEEC